VIFLFTLVLSQEGQISILYEIQTQNSKLYPIFKIFQFYTPAAIPSGSQGWPPSSFKKALAAIEDGGRGFLKKKSTFQPCLWRQGWRSS
jgi:hypothetical protein